jgi:hypothetical protein
MQNSKKELFGGLSLITLTLLFLSFSLISCNCLGQSTKTVTRLYTAKQTKLLMQIWSKKELPKNVKIVPIKGTRMTIETTINVNCKSQTLSALIESGRYDIFFSTLTAIRIKSPLTVNKKQLVETYKIRILLPIK